MGDGFWIGLALLVICFYGDPSLVEAVAEYLQSITPGAP